MPRGREFLCGSRDRFAVHLAFLPDPDKGCAVSPEVSLSWGSLQIWVNGHNLCAHVEQGEPVAAVHWYLLPFLQWLTTNWDFLLHEERLPGKIAGANAWLSMRRTSEPPSGLSEDNQEQWETSWYDWWQRHCLLACREGGLFPSVYIRRWQDSIEISWGDRPLAGAPDHFHFNAFPSATRLDPDDVAWVLFDILDNAVRHLLEEMSESFLLQQLVEDVKQLQTSNHRRRLGLLSGYRIDREDPEIRGQELQDLFPKDLPPGSEEALFGSRRDNLVVRYTGQAALMFGSLAPNINCHDAKLLAQQLVTHFSPNKESVELHNFVRNEPLEKTTEQAWDQGYELAEGLHENLGHNYIHCDSWVDIEKIYQYFQIATDDIALHDRSIRAVAIAGPTHQPVVLINQNYAWRDEQPRRFTLAHELCHILHDRGYASQLAIASGPWAPVDVEKRANAFAAMFLMPGSLVAKVIANLKVPLTTQEEIRQVADTMHTSFTATLEHLCNLNFLDEPTRDALRPFKYLYD